MQDLYPTQDDFKTLEYNGGEICCFFYNGAVWFILHDIEKALGYKGKNANNITRYVDDSMVGWFLPRGEARVSVCLSLEGVYMFLRVRANRLQYRAAKSQLLLFLNEHFPRESEASQQIAVTDKACRGLCT